jgi:hypothetical protein
MDLKKGLEIKEKQKIKIKGRTFSFSVLARRLSLSPTSPHVQLSLSPSLRSADVRGPHGSVISYLKTARRQYDGPLKEVAALILGSS